MKKAVGIYVSKNALQFMVISRGLGRVRFLAAGSVKIPPDVIIGSVAGSAKPIDITVKRPDARPGRQKTLTSFELAVKSLLKQHDVKDGQVIAAALPSEFVVIRYFQMARLPQQEHKTAVPFEARKYLPYKLEDIVYAYTISYDKVASNKMAVIFVAAEKTSVTNYTRFFENIGLKVGYLEPVPYSLKRFFYYIKSVELPETAALVHISRESANINLVRNKILYLTRNVSFSTKADERFDNFLSEARLSFDYFHRQFPEEKIEKMLVWSDDKGIQPLAEIVGKDLNVQVKVINPFDNIEGASGYSVEYAVSTGLALRSIYEPDQDVNMSPGFKKIEIEKLLKLLLIEIGVAAAILFVFGLIDGSKTKALGRELAMILGQRSVSEMQAGSISVKGMEEKKLQAQDNLNYLKSLSLRRIVVHSKLDRISDLVPDGVWLEEFTYAKARNKGNPGFVLRGYAYRERGDDQIKAINQFLENLKRDSLFSKGLVEIKLDSILNEKYAGISVTSFQISCNTE